MEISTRCAGSGRRLHILVNSELEWRVGERGAQPLIFEPEVEWSGFRAPNILHDY